MATTFSDDSIPGDQLVYTWTLGNADTGEAKRIGGYGDKSYAMWGAFGAPAATVVIEGSWDEPDTLPASGSWMTLHETDNSTSISFATATIGAILEDPVWIRVKSSGGTDTAVIVAISAPWRR